MLLVECSTGIEKDFRGYLLFFLTNHHNQAA